MPLLCFSSNLEELVCEILSNNPTGSTGESLILFVLVLNIVLGSHIQQRIVVMLSFSIYFVQSSCNFDYYKSGAPLKLFFKAI